MAITLLPAIPSSIAPDKLGAALLLIGTAYWLKEPVLTALPFGTHILFLLQTTEQLLSVTVSHTLKGLIFVLESAGFVVEFSLSIIDILFDSLLMPLYLR